MAMPDPSTLLSAFVTLLVTIGPFETAPIFSGLTAGFLPAERQRIVTAYIQANGLPSSLTDSVNFLSNRFVRQSDPCEKISLRIALCSAHFSG